MRKEFEEVIKNKYILSTMASFPLVFSIAIPMIYLLTIPSNISEADVAMFEGLIPNFDSMTPQQSLIYYIVQSNLPFYLMMPSVIPTLISSYSIVGEKKGGTLEPLLATPVSSRDILLGKSLAAVIPSVLITWFSFLIYMTLVDAMTFKIFNYPILPNTLWFVSIFITAPLLTLMSVYLSILVSSKVNDIRAAQQISAVFVVPIMGVFVLQLFGYVSIDISTMIFFSLIIFIMDIILVRAGTKIFRREEILTKWA
ncbi:ABC transporter permease [Methanocella sp. CWC-04]|uniref:ABC transporter permease n=2 Tax=Methanooceanicella nereidis TaxID=2052831 RepID=A0AAP2W3Q9_9EURY|nr:ABC transporter permease subunit [Methanocella sp. CWC-04]MCD1293400.1 ABC transporter permease [Methanocella sp. CWC-04]